MNEVSVSIVIPTFNRPQLLLEAIASALAQVDYSNFEVIVCDNDPSPESAVNLGKMVARFGNSRLSYHQNQTNLGMTGNWNRCIELAKGPYVSILHDDDILLPNFLSRSMVFAADHDLVVCNVLVGATPPDASCGRIKPRGGRRHRRTPSRITAADLAFSNISPAPGIIFKKELALELGGFDDAYYPCSDYDFWMRYCDRFRAIRMPEFLAFYRVNQNESLKIATRIEIAEKAYELQQKYLGGRSCVFPFSRVIPALSVGGLLDGYCDDPLFRDSLELKAFLKRRKIYFHRHRKISHICCDFVKNLFRLFCVKGNK